jgi:riboflavin transporter
MQSNSRSTSLQSLSRSPLAALAIKGENTATLAILVGIAVTAPFIHQQLVSGTIVNATLIVGVCLLGTREALVIGLLPSSVALGCGLLPAALAPAVPYLIVGNAILVVAFDYVRRVSYWVGVGVAALLKAAFLTGISGVVINLLLDEQLSSKVSTMLSFPQLVTALAGGVLAFGVLAGLGALGIRGGTTREG